MPLVAAGTHTPVVCNASGWTLKRLQREDQECLIQGTEDHQDQDVWIFRKTHIELEVNSVHWDTDRPEAHVDWMVFIGSVHT